MDLDHFSLKTGHVFQSGLAFGILFTRDYFFESTLSNWQSFSIVFTQKEASYVLVTCGYILESRTSFRGSEMGYYFSLGSKIGHLKSQILICSEIYTPLPKL